MLKKLDDGLNLIENAWGQYQQGAGREYTRDNWKTNINTFGLPPLAGETIILTGYGMLFVFPVMELPEQLMPSVDKMLYMTEEERQSTFWVQVLIPRLQLWFLSCCADINNNYENITDEERGILVRGLNSFLGKEFWEDKQLQELLRKSNVSITDTKKQYQLLEKHVHPLASKLIKEALIHLAEFKDRDGNYPVIYFLQEPRGTILAQMCIWAYRQCLREKIYAGWEDELVGYVDKYVSKKIKGVSREYAEEHANSITSILLTNWKAPSSKGSFDTYIFNSAKGIFIDTFKKEDCLKEISIERISEGEISKLKPTGKRSKRTGKIRGKTSKEKVIYPVSVREAASILECQVRWLYRNLESGEVKNAGNTHVTVVSEGLYSTKTNYLLDEDSIKQAKELLSVKNLRIWIINYLVDKKSITQRGARKWIKSRLDKGQLLKDIAKEALEKR